MNRLYFVALALVCSSTVANATVVTFTDSDAFFAANPDATLIENFEDSDPHIRDGSLPSYTGPGGEITFTPVTNALYPLNVYLASPGYTTWGTGLNPNTSVILAVTGNEDFVGTLAAPAYSLGFNVFLNDQPAILQFFNGTTLLATLIYDYPIELGNNLGFGGIYSSEGVTSFRWISSNGQNVDTGVDNIFEGPLVPSDASSVPEPSTWAMMLLGFGAIGAALRKRKRPLAQAG